MGRTTTEAQGAFDAVIKEVQGGNSRVALTREGTPVAAVVPIEDLEYLEALEAQEDAEDVEACKAAENESSRPFSEVKKELGLCR